MAKKDSDKDKKIVDQAHKRFAWWQDTEHENNLLFEEDLRFANADSDNGWQWDEKLVKSREGKPSLTINKVKQHNRHIINEARQNKPSIKIYPVDGNADKKTAEIFNGVIRHIEANSSADTAYDTASEYAVDAGIGYWRVTTDYIDEESFDQEIYIKRVPNPLNVALGPHQEADGSDAQWGLIFEDVLKEEFDAIYPDADYQGWETLDNGWQTEDTIRLAEYYYIEEKQDMLYADENGNVLLASKADPDMLAAIKVMPDIKSRKITVPQVKWCLIAGKQILDRKDWLGKYIPIVRLVGDEQVIDGKTVRKGHTRQMKDSQRMYNYWTSSATEFVALQGKQPYLIAAESIEGYTKFWEDANNSNLPYLPFNAIDENGNALPMPKRQEAPVMATAYIQGMQIASDEMKATSGQYDAQFGKNVNQQSGTAINALESKSDMATFHFTDNKARSIKYTGKILIDLIPKVFDTARIVRILGEDDSEEMVQLDPNQLEAMREQHKMDGAIKQIYNLGVGRYDVIVSVGQSYGTKRREAFTAMSEMAARNPALMQIAGDLIMKAGDFPMAEELAERLKKALPPNLQDEPEGQSQIPPEMQQAMQQAQQQIQMLDNTIQKMSEELEAKDLERGKLEIDWYNAETNRAKVAQVGMSPEQIQMLVIQTLRDLMQPNMPMQQGQQESMPPMQPPMQ